MLRRLIERGEDLASRLNPLAGLGYFEEVAAQFVVVGLVGVCSFGLSLGFPAGGTVGLKWTLPSFSPSSKISFSLANGSFSDFIFYLLLDF